MKKIQEMTNEELQNALEVMSTMEEAKTTVEKIKAEMKTRKEKEALKEQEAEATLVAEQKDILGRYFKNDLHGLHFYYKVNGVYNDWALVECFTTNNNRRYTSDTRVRISLLKSYTETTKAEYDAEKKQLLENISSIFDLFPGFLF